MRCMLSNKTAYTKSIPFTFAHTDALSFANTNTDSLSCCDAYTDTFSFTITDTIGI